jgi:hypothetical protein
LPSFTTRNVPTVDTEPSRGSAKVFGQLRGGGSKPYLKIVRSAMATVIAATTFVYSFDANAARNVFVIAPKHYVIQQSNRFTVTCSLVGRARKLQVDRLLHRHDQRWWLDRERPHL